MKKFIAIVFSFLFIFSMGVSLVHGGDGGTTGGVDGGTTDVEVTLDNPFSIGDDLFDLLKAVINDILLPIGGILVVLAFIYSGFLYVKAQGKPGDLEKAHNALLFTAVGAALLLGSWVIANVIKTTIEQIMP